MYPTFAHTGTDNRPIWRDRAHARVRRWSGRIRFAPEAGFSLVELLVGMLIIGVISAIVLPSLFGAKNRAYEKSAAAAAFSYQDGIEAFKSDHGNRAPDPRVPAHWSTPLLKGPQDEFANRAYMRNVPDAVNKGQVGFATAVGTVPAAPAGSDNAYVSYVLWNSTTYSLIVRIKNASTGAFTNYCVINSNGAATAGMRPC